MEVQNEMIRVSQDFLRAVASPIDQVVSSPSTVTGTPYGARLTSPSYLHFAKFGRGKGKAPPIDKIIAWVKKKGLASDINEITKISFSIANSISKKGTLNHTPNAPDYLTTLLNENFKKYFDEVAKIATISISGGFVGQNIFVNKITI